MDMVTTMKALNKTVEASQLTSDLGGTFTYSHTDWVQFHQVLFNVCLQISGSCVNKSHSIHLMLMIKIKVSCGVRRDCCKTTAHKLEMTCYPHTHTKHPSSLLLLNATWSFSF